MEITTQLSNPEAYTLRPVEEIQQAVDQADDISAEDRVTLNHIACFIKTGNTDQARKMIDCGSEDIKFYTIQSEA